MRVWLLPFIFALLGFLFSTRNFLKVYDKLPPYAGLILYYLILTITLLLLQYFGLIVGGMEFNSWRHTVGSMLIIFSFFIVFDWESCYVNIVTKGSCNNKEISNIYMASEDGAVYDLWSRAIKNVDTCRVLTYIVTPFVLTFIGLLFLTEKKVRLN